MHRAGVRRDRSTQSSLPALGGLRAGPVRLPPAMATTDPSRPPQLRLVQNVLRGKHAVCGLQAGGLTL